MNSVPHFTFERTKMMPGFDGRECKIYPRLVETEKGIFLSYSMLLLSGIDVFNDCFFVKSLDGGKTFGEPEKLQRLETIADGVRTLFLPATEHYSKHHKTWFVFGCSVSYENDEQARTFGGVDISKAGVAIRDTESGHYTGDVLPLPLPFAYISATPHGQILEYENGDLLLTFHTIPLGETKSKALAIRYRYENDKFSILRAGDLLTAPGVNRLVEPSVAKLGNRYFMTLRTDEQGLLAAGNNGFHYSEPSPWKWDDGSILENYNTMQRWIRYKERLYLAYTRRGANNDHVFRHRAPIFMAQFDAEHMCLIKESEVILVPELGARLGNFTVTERSEKEFWLLTAEWMQPIGCEKYGSDNAIWIAKIRFE